MFLQWSGRVAGITAASLVVLAASSAEAAVWTGAVNSQWSNSANWSGTAPTQFGVQPIVFAAAGAGNLSTVTGHGGQFFISDLSTNANASSFSINAGGGSNEIAISGDVYINQGAANLVATVGEAIFFNKVANTTLSFNIDGPGRAMSAKEIHRHSVASLRPGQTVIKNGSGSLSLSGTSTYHGETQINGGRLNVNGSHVNGSAYQVNSTGVLGGTGSTGSAVNVNAGGKLAPGLSIGTFGTGSLSLTSATAALDFELNVTASPAADLVNVTGGVTLGGGVLNLSPLGVPSGTFPRTYLLIANDGSDAVSGVFGSITGLPGGYSATINTSFSGADVLGRIGTGNDVAVTINVPEPASLGLLVIGLGLLRRRGLRQWA